MELNPEEQKDLKELEQEAGSIVQADQQNDSEKAKSQPTQSDEAILQSENAERMQRWEQAKAVIGEMMRLGLEPSLTTYYMTMHLVTDEVDWTIFHYIYFLYKKWEIYGIFLTFILLCSSAKRQTPSKNFENPFYYIHDFFPTLIFNRKITKFFLKKFRPIYIVDILIYFVIRDIFRSKYFEFK